MKIYAPYTEWKTEINDLSIFEEFLKESTDTSGTGRYTRYKGRISPTDFVIERNLDHQNANRPQIHGVIESNSSGKTELTLTIQSKKLLLYFFLVFAAAITLIAIIQLNPFALFGILIVAFWLWLMGLIFHQIELGKTKLEVEFLLEKAQSL
ncbi:MAG: hypothetical protein AB8B56_20105 [Crocinitomicaceae bacterium]